MIKLSITKTNIDWIDVIWTKEVVIQIEGQEDTIESKQINCESFSGHREHIEMLKNKCVEFGTKLNKEQLKIIDEISKAFVYPDENDILKEIETQRVLSIKSKAKGLIEKEYPLYKQNNILMSGISIDIKDMNDYISKIRIISNEAEANGTALELIDWKL